MFKVGAECRMYLKITFFIDFVPIVELDSDSYNPVCTSQPCFHSSFLVRLLNCPPG
jgi:hypothetical protein